MMARTVLINRIQKILIVLSLLFLNKYNHAQVLNQDADGKSSILWKGGTIGFDVPEGMVKASYYSFSKGMNGVVWGLDIQGESEEGIANLFKDGEFVPKGEASAVIGGKKTWIHMPSDSAQMRANLISERLKTKGLLNKKVLTAAEKAYSIYVDSLVVGCDETCDLNREVRKSLQKGFRPSQRKKQIKTVKGLVTLCRCPELIVQMRNLESAISNDSLLQYTDSLNTRITQLTKRIKGISSAIRTTSYLLYSLRGGVGAMEFKYDHGSDSTISFGTRFQDTVFVSGFAEINLTYRYRDWFFGFSGGFARSHNFSELEKDEYKYSISDTTLTEGSLEQSESFKAYSGNYGLYWRPYFNIDVMKMIALSKKDGKYLGAGLYLRNNFSSDTSLIRGNTVLGGALNFIDSKSGKFQGGVYLQSDDISGRLEKNFAKTIRFGLVARVSFSAIFPN